MLEVKVWRKKMSVSYDFFALEELNGFHTDQSGVFAGWTRLGLKIIPLNPNTLEPYSWEAAGTPEEAEECRKRFPDALPGIVAGDALIAVEVPAEKSDFFRNVSLGCGINPDTLPEIFSRQCKTWLFSNPERLEIACESCQGVYIRGRNGYTCGAPSRTPDGRIWEIYNGYIQPFPTILREALRTGACPPAPVTQHSAESSATPARTTEVPPALPHNQPAKTETGDRFADWTQEAIRKLQTPLEQALFYARHGIPVFPCNSNTKKPLTSKGQSNGARWSATTEPGLITGYFTKHADALVGGVMGEESGLIAVDCDIKHGTDAVAAFRDLCAEHGFDPEKTLAVKTPSGGMHYLFRHPSGVDIRNTESYPRPSIDIRANGGFLVMAGSKIGPNGEHPGQSYCMRNDCKPVPLPPFLVEMLRKKEEPAPAAPFAPSGLSAAEGLKELERIVNLVAKCPEGSRNATLNKASFYCGLLIRDGLLAEPFANPLLIQAGLSSGLPENEVLATVGRSLQQGKESAQARKKAISMGPQKTCQPAPEDKAGKDPFTPGVLTRYALRGGITDMLDLGRRILPPKTFDLVKRYSEINRIPVESVIPILMGMIAACISGRRLVSIKDGYEVGANFYQVNLGHTCSGKSTTVDYFLDALKQKEAEYETRYKAEMEQYNEEMAAYKRNKCEGIKPAKPVKKQLICDDATPEAAFTMHGENPSGLLWAVDEGSGWFTRIGRYNKNGGGEEKAKLIQAWNCQRVKVSRQKHEGEDRDYVIHKAFFSIIVNLQPELMSTLFKESDEDQGLLQRFLFNFIPSKQPGDHTP